MIWDYLKKKRCLPGLSVSMQREEMGTDFLLEHALSVAMLRPRVPADVLFVLGGWSRDGVCSIMETYDDRVHRWFKVIPLSFCLGRRVV